MIVLFCVVVFVCVSVCVFNLNILIFDFNLLIFQILNSGNKMAIIADNQETISRILPGFYKKFPL